jgi:hypothetical protein
MTDKAGRNYELDLELVAGSGNSIVIKPPLTMTFNVQRSILATANTASLSIYNLGELTRRKIFHDLYDTTTFRGVILKAGYGNNIAEIFNGNMRQAWSTRQGTEWVTQIDGFDGGWDIINGFMSESLPVGWDVQTVVRKIINKSFHHVTAGSLSLFTDVSQRGIILHGNSWDIIKKLNPDGFTFIDMGKAHCLKLGEYIPYTGQIYKITASQGLLDTPRRQQSNLMLRMLFEPRIKVGTIVEVESLETVNNGQYQVVGVTHQGTISEAVCGECSTTIQLYLGAQQLKVAGS